MPVMTEPQSWVLIGTFTAVMMGVCTIMIAMMAAQGRHFATELTLLREGIMGEVRGELTALRHEMRGELTAVRSEIATTRSDLQAEIATTRADLQTEIAMLDKDVQAISRRIFGDEKL